MTQKAIQDPDQENPLLRSLRPNRIIIPILLGLGVAGYMLYQDIVGQNLIENFRQPNLFWLFMALLCLLVRDGFYIYRIHYLTRKGLSWKGSFYTIILWEFSSAISPSAVGGTALASFLLLKEGLSFGKSLAYVLVSAILDNLFFITAGLLILLLNVLNVFPNGIFYLDGVSPEITATLRYTFYISFTVIALYNLLMVYGLFVRPQVIKGLFFRITSLRWLRRWRRAAIRQGDELVIASDELKGIGWAYWTRAVVSTLLVWTARYLIVNCLIMAFFSVSLADNGLIFSRHVVLWVVLLIGITPGAAGIAEYAFKGFFTPFAGGMTTFIAVLWRMITYYPYLILGVLFLPRWLKRVFVDKPAQDPLVSAEK
ncbi:MAG: flippase-like domain-containing protein [Microscillaceae bacterium]|nr:flippase-like domain-containing protein [Microscillaceae bacterium]